MTKAQTRQLLIEAAIDRMTEYLIADFQLDTLAAMNFIYNSDTINLLQNGKTGLYYQSPAYVYELLKREYLTGKVS